MSVIKIRAARPEDVEAIYEMLRASAAHQRAEHELCVDPSSLLEDGFTRQPPRFQCLVAECDGQVAGIALFFLVYSTWTSRTAVYLEDLYVSPQVRRRGVARALMGELAQIANSSACRFIRWLVLSDNVEATRFYESLGAELSEDFKVMWLEVSNAGPTLAHKPGGPTEP
jgi:GNAT superfamily N-acetyltransferase